MRCALIITCLVLLCMACQGTPALGQQNGEQVAENRPDATDSRFRERAVRKRQYLACYEAQKRVCYDQYSQAVKWCQDNWEKCLPLISGTGLHAGTYGRQVLEECKAKLRKRCRQEAGM